jgi:hypothetical protein
VVSHSKSARTWYLGVRFPLPAPRVNPCNSFWAFFLLRRKRLEASSVEASQRDVKATLNALAGVSRGTEFSCVLSFIT